MFEGGEEPKNHTASGSRAPPPASVKGAFQKPKPHVPRSSPEASSRASGAGSVG